MDVPMKTWRKLSGQLEENLCSHRFWGFRDKRLGGLQQGSSVKVGMVSMAGGTKTVVRNSNAMLSS